MPKAASFHCEINIKFWFGRLIKYDIYHIIVWRSCALDGLQCFPVGNIRSKNNYHILFHLISTLLVMRNAHRWHSLAPNPLHAHLCVHGQHTKILYSKFYWTKIIGWGNIVIIHKTYEYSAKRIHDDALWLFIKVLVFYYRFSELFFGIL